MKALGYIIGGSLTDGFVMRICNSAHLEEIKTGKFVSIVSGEHRYFSLVTDLTLHVTQQEIMHYPPAPHETLLMEILRERSMYATATLRPMLSLVHKKPSPVKTMAPHFSCVYEATAEDISLIFGSEEIAPKYFTIGCPLDMQVPVCIDLEKLTERSNGIFGKTGTGKTFLTRIVLAGILSRDIASLLIFDMHSEYGLQARQESNTRFVKGLKTLFPHKVAICSLDPTSTRRRGTAPDLELLLPYQSITVDDIACLQQELNLHPTAVEAAYLVYGKHKQDWLQILLQQGERLKEFAQEVGAHPESLAALYRKLKRVERLPFLYHSDSTTEQLTVIDQIMAYLHRGVSVIIEFGNFTSTFCYLLIANILTRRIHAEYTHKTEQFLGSHNRADEPRKLLIVIEEAHKFLNSQTAKQTIFGIIAREMRKYYVSLLVVDQRPSGIDPEILSQIGTKIVAQLSDERDIQAVLTGVNGSTQLRSILACLDTKKQALVLGHAIAMPVVVETRTYDEQFYQAVTQIVSHEKINAIIEQIF